MIGLALRWPCSRWPWPSRSRAAKTKLVEAVRAQIELQAEPVRRQAYRTLADQREDPVVAGWAAYALAELGDPQFIPQWRPGASLDEVAFQVHMAGTWLEELPAAFVSKRGLVSRRIVLGDRELLESFDPPWETVVHTAWGPNEAFVAPWGEDDHLDAAATYTRCEEGREGPVCRSEIDGRRKTIGFEVQPGGGLKVRTVTVEVDIPNCIL